MYSSSHSHPEDGYFKIISGAVVKLPNSSLNDVSTSSTCNPTSTTIGPGGTLEQILLGDGGYQCDDRSRLFVVLSWCTSLLRKIAHYLSKSSLVILGPLILGLVVGVVIGRYSVLLTHTTHSGDNNTTWISKKKKDGERDMNITTIEGNSNSNSLSGVLRSSFQGTMIQLIAMTSKFIISIKKRTDSISTNDGNDGTVDTPTLLRSSSSSNPPSLSSSASTTTKTKSNESTASTTTTTSTSMYTYDKDETRDNQIRQHLTKLSTQPQSNLHPSAIPKHIAVIMDGNRRYGKSKYNSITKGHFDGAKVLMECSKWCIAEGVQVLTVYAFSTENWSRSEGEVAALMGLFCEYCDELRVEALKRGVRLCVLSTQSDQIPKDVQNGINKMMEQTKHCTNFTMNICFSYGSRGEIINAVKDICTDVQNKTLSPSDITEATFESKLLTCSVPDPDVVIRTSGEYRLSNFLLWQLAYSEMFFLEKTWPELTKEDLVGIIREYAIDRKRRYGK